MLIPEFRSTKSVRVFAQGWCEEAREFAPQAVAARLEQLEEIDVAPTHAIVVMGRIEDRRLSEADRERLWARFGVPVFEQIIGDRGELLAAECEAHEGLHVTSDRAREWGAMDEALCGCGRKSPRLIFGEKSVAVGR